MDINEIIDNIQDLLTLCQNSFGSASLAEPITHRGNLKMIYCSFLEEIRDKKEKGERIHYEGVNSGFLPKKFLRDYFEKAIA